MDELTRLVKEMEANLAIAREAVADAEVTGKFTAKHSRSIRVSSKDLMLNCRLLRTETLNHLKKVMADKKSAK